jgi:TRAP-type C4-dicarboxylate transport system permease small subunit
MTGEENEQETEAARGQPNNEPWVGALPPFSAAWGFLARISRLTSRLTSAVGIFGLVMLILFTVVDVLGSKVFSRPFPGYTGVTELAELIAMSFAMGVTFLAGQHIKVEILLSRIPHRAGSVVSSFTNLLALALFVLIVWRLVVLGLSFQASGEVVDQINIPLFPFPYLTALALVPVCLALLYNLGNSLHRAVRG